MFKSLLMDYGLPWAINRSLYSLKLGTLNKIPSTERIYEKPVRIKRVDIFEFNRDGIEKFLIKLPSDKQEEIIQNADKAIEGKIKAFSSIELDYGNPIRWHYNPITKVKVDKTLKWFQIPDFDPVRGDIKVIWEASRFTHFYYFIRAYLITKNKKYYNAFSNQLDNWVEENKYAYGPNYKCGQEATLRMINALIVYSGFKSCGLSDDRDKKNIETLVTGSYRKVLSNFFYAHKCIKNNHTLSEITGLIIGAWCSEDQIRLEKSYMLLNNEINEQFSLDGGYIQNSFNYQRLALQLMEFNIKISEKTKFNISFENKERIKNSVFQIYQLQDNSGDVPNRGANDGALLFPVTSCSYRDFRPIINSISCLLNNQRVYKSGLYDEEILWFSDKELSNTPINLTEKKSSAFYEAGLFSLRKDQETFLMTILKDNKTRPGQMDQLHIDLWYKGLNVLCDSGSYSYADPIGRKLSLTASHNTVKIDDIEQMNRKGNFLVTDWSKRKDVYFDKNNFNGTLISKNGYKHTRNIKKVNQGFSVKDEIIGDGKQAYFHFHTPCDVEKNSDGITLIDKGTPICNIQIDGEIEVTKSIRSLYYLRKEEIYHIIVTKPVRNGKCVSNYDIKFINEQSK